MASASSSIRCRCQDAKNTVRRTMYCKLCRRWRRRTRQEKVLRLHQAKCRLLSTLLNRYSFSCVSYHYSSRAGWLGSRVVRVLLRRSPVDGTQQQTRPVPRRQPRLRVVHGSILCDPTQPNPWTTLPRLDIDLLEAIYSASTDCFGRLLR